MLDQHIGDEGPPLVAEKAPMQDEESPMPEMKPELHCPRCARGMVLRSRAGSGVAQCVGCGGAWFPGELLDRQLRDHLGDPTASLERFSWEPIESEADLPCPACDPQNLVPVMVGDVEIDRCDLCGGVYLDAGELEALSAAHPSPEPAPSPTDSVPVASWGEVTAYSIVELVLSSLE